MMTGTRSPRWSVSVSGGKSTSALKEADLPSTETVIVDVSAKGNEIENMTETDLQDLDEVRCMELNVQ